MEMAIAELRRPAIDNYHGIEVLDIHADDPIPEPRAPQRFAVRVTPDLARAWLALNHPDNRKQREPAIQKYAADMAAGFFDFTPQSIVFSSTGVLEDGQNRLMAVTVFGAAVWMMVDFGWPDGIINKIDRGIARVPSDAFKIEGIAQANLAAAAVQTVTLYNQTVGTSLSWTSGRFRASTSQAVQAYRQDEVLWHEAIKAGRPVSENFKALTSSLWAAAFFVIAKECDERDTVGGFYAELLEGTGDPGTATRRLEKLYTRRKVSDTVTGDPREPMENIIRAFNAYVTGKPFSHTTRPGFVLSRARHSR